MLANIFTSSPLPLLLPLLTAAAIPGQAQETETLIVTVTATSSSPPSYTSPADFQNTVLTVSNTYRTAHNASSLVWNDSLAKYAQDWAQRCEWKHSDGPYGENLAFGYPNATSAVEAWGNEDQFYNFELPTGFSEKTGHFTQLVWRATTEVGCAAVDCGYTEDDRNEDGSYTRAQGWYVVCEYTPAGNVMGGDAVLGDKEYFKVNVQPTSTYSGPYNTDSSNFPTTTAEGGTGRRAGCGNSLLGVWGTLVYVSLGYLW